LGKLQEVWEEICVISSLIRRGLREIITKSQAEDPEIPEDAAEWEKAIEKVEEKEDIMAAKLRKLRPPLNLPNSMKRFRWMMK